MTWAELQISSEDDMQFLKEAEHQCYNPCCFSFTCRARSEEMQRGPGVGESLVKEVPHGPPPLPPVRFDPSKDPKQSAAKFRTI